MAVGNDSEYRETLHLLKRTIRSIRRRVSHNHLPARYDCLKEVLACQVGALKSLCNGKLPDVDAAKLKPPSDVDMATQHLENFRYVVEECLRRGENEDGAFFKRRARTLHQMKALKTMAVVADFVISKALAGELATRKTDIAGKTYPR